VITTIAAFIFPKGRLEGTEDDFSFILLTILRFVKQKKKTTRFWILLHGQWYTDE